MILVMGKQSHAITSINEKLDAEAQSADRIPGQFPVDSAGHRIADHGVNVDWPFPGLPGKKRQQDGAAGSWRQK
jgi:hypothetical protein